MLYLGSASRNQHQFYEQYWIISPFVIAKILSSNLVPKRSRYEVFDAKKEKENSELGLQILLEYGIL